MAGTDVSLVQQNSQNPVISSISDVFGTITGAANQLAGAYSTFIGAKTNAKIASMNGTVNPYQSTQGDIDVLNALQAKQFGLLTMAAVGLAILGTGVLIYKSVK